MKLLKEADVRDKRVLVRVGFDVPINSNGQITDTTRIEASLPTINYLRDQGAKLILISHLGRPEGQMESEDSLLPVAQYLEMLLKTPVEFITEKMEESITYTLKSLEEKEVIMLENLRFHQGEENNDPDFAKWLASLGEVYVNDAFSDCHREHASMVGLPKLLPSFAGLALEKELTTLQKLITRPVHPVVAIIGGAKLESKLPVITRLIPIVDRLLIGSKFIGQDLPDSPKLFLPRDFSKDEKGSVLDIGEETSGIYIEEIKKAKTIFWSGPLGKFEDDRYSKGTKTVAEAVVNSTAETIIGGGDTIAAFAKFNLLDKVSFASTGGSAMLDFIAGKKLPGLESLDAA